MYLVQKILGALTQPLIAALLVCVLAAFLRLLWPRLLKWAAALAASIVYLSAIARC